MKITPELTDDAVLTELGTRLARRRIDLQLTQEALAEQAGIGKRTLERMESGKAAQLTTLVRVLRVLDAMSGLESLVPEAGPRPMDLLKRKNKQRQRASSPRGYGEGHREGPLEANVEGSGEGKVAEREPWRWGEDA
jgi:transcriptional regulator with XRE-family HTH domain